MPPAHSPQPSLLKRPLDVCLAGVGLLLSLPLWLLIAVCITLEDGGPVFYTQQRVGKQGRRFACRKFRSMQVDAAQHFDFCPAGPHDPRVTRLGRWLRATALDELPQLWHILRGEMSFVGPRPLVPIESDPYSQGDLVPLEDIPGYAARHQVLPGLTGLAQVYAARDLPRRDKFRFDLLYIEQQTFWLDLKLLLLSLWRSAQGQCEQRQRPRYPGAESAEQESREAVLSQVAQEFDVCTACDHDGQGEDLQCGAA
jgi:lipopolysaccharide/colanic/teichoic acid biosynthesis glycosyltransferase